MRTEKPLGPASGYQPLRSKGAATLPPVLSDLPPNSLGAAARNRQTGLARLLLEAAGADPNGHARGACCLTPLQIAIEEIRPDIVDLLLSFGADPNLSALPKWCWATPR